MSAPVKNSAVAGEKEKLSVFGIVKDLVGTALITVLILTPIVLIRTKLEAYARAEAPARKGAKPLRRAGDKSAEKPVEA